MYSELAIFSEFPSCFVLIANFYSHILAEDRGVSQKQNETASNGRPFRKGRNIPQGEESEAMETVRKYGGNLGQGRSRVDIMAEKI